MCIFLLYSSQSYLVFASHSPVFRSSTLFKTAIWVCIDAVMMHSWKYEVKYGVVSLVVQHRVDIVHYYSIRYTYFIVKLFNPSQNGTTVRHRHYFLRLRLSENLSLFSHFHKHRIGRRCSQTLPTHFFPYLFLSLSSELLNFCQVPFPLIHFMIESEE